MNVMKYRTYSKYEKDQSRFEVRFQRLMDLEDYLCSCENDESINVTMCADETRGYRIDYPFVIKQKPLYGLCPAIYIIEVFAKNLKELGLPAGWGTCIDVQEVEDSGNFYVKRSDRYYVKTDHYGLFPTYEGHYRFRTYKPAWNTVRKKEDVDHLFESDIDVVKQTIELNSNFLKEELKERMNMMFGVDLNMIPEIKDVKFNNPATIVFWADGTKTVVKRQKGDRFNKEKGLAMAIVKKLYGNKGKYNDLFKKWIKEDK